MCVAGSIPGDSGLWVTGSKYLRRIVLGFPRAASDFLVFSSLQTEAAFFELLLQQAWPIKSPSLAHVFLPYQSLRLYH